MTVGVTKMDGDSKLSWYFVLLEEDPKNKSIRFASFRRQVRDDNTSSGWKTVDSFHRKKNNKHKGNLTFEEVPKPSGVAAEAKQKMIDSISKLTAEFD